MSQSLISNLQIAGYTDMQWVTRMAVRKDKVVLRDILNKALNNISTEQHNSIYKKWVTPTIKESVVDYTYLWYLFGLIVGIIALYIMKVIANKQLALEVKEKTSELIRKNEQLEEAQEIAKLGSWRLDMIHDKLLWSNEVYRIFGKESFSFEPSYKNFLDFIHPDDRNKVKESFENSVKEKTQYDIIHRIGINKEIKYVRERGTTHYIDGDKPSFTQGTV